MTDDIDWSDACRRVAEWLGDYEYVTSVEIPVVDGTALTNDRFCYDFKKRDGNSAWVDMWTDFTSCDAAAMRLQRRLPESAEWFSSGDEHSWRAYKSVSWFKGVCEVRYEWDHPTLGLQHIPISRHEDARKALVLAACELIDMGVEPREVAR